jgi:hypothetical protein
VFLTKQVDNYKIDRFVLSINTNSIETLLSIVASSMLVIATFAVGLMVAAYSSASTTATPRSFPPHRYRCPAGYCGKIATGRLKGHICPIGQIKPFLGPCGILQIQILSLFPRYFFQ